MENLKSEEIVVKSNALVEARYRLTLQESQVVLWLLTQIRQEDEDFKPHKLEISKFAKFIGVRIDGKYDELRKITKRLMQRVMEIYDPQTQELLQVSWLSSAKYEYKKGTVILKFDPGLKPYLLQLKTQFTKISVTDTLKLKSVYVIRILELLIQYETIGKRKMSIEDIRLWCGIEKDKYQLYAHLKTKVIEKAKSEITAKTEYQVDYSEIKQSRKVVAIEWIIAKKNQEEEKHKSLVKKFEAELDARSLLKRELMDYGYSKSLATKTVKENDEVVVRNALSSVGANIKKNQVKNPGAMLRVAIKEKWQPDVRNKQNKNQSVDECESVPFKLPEDCLPKFKNF